VATADLFPRFSLTGTFGFESNQIGTLAEGNSPILVDRAVGAVAGLRGGDGFVPNIAAQGARAEQAAARYEQAVLLSLEETENALVSFGPRAGPAGAVCGRRLAANVKAVSLSNQLYANGLSDFQAVLDSQRPALPHSGRNWS